MAETPPSDPSALRVQTDMAKGEDQGKGFEPLDASKRVTANGGESSSGASMPFAGEMERRGEEKVSLYFEREYSKDTIS